MPSLGISSSQTTNTPSVQDELRVRLRQNRNLLKLARSTDVDSESDWESES
jgi:hypothetical protein